MSAVRRASANRGESGRRAQIAREARLPSENRSDTWRAVGHGARRTGVIRFNNMQTPWHYTYGPRWELICASGLLLCATKHVLPPEKPVVWFSINQTWEPTSVKGIVNPDGTVRDATFDWLAEEVGCIRISLNPEGRKLLHHYRHFQRLAHPPTHVRKALERAARDAGADPGHWFFCLEPVPAHLWDKVEIFERGQWIDIRQSKYVPQVPHGERSAG